VSQAEPSDEGASSNARPDDVVPGTGAERAAGAEGAGAEKVSAAAGSEETSESEDEQPRRSGPGALLKELVVVVVAALVISMLVKTFLFRAYLIPSESMENTLQVGDRVFANLLVPGPFDLHRGDVVVFKDEQGWLADEPQPAPAGPVADVLTFLGLRPDDSSQYLIKRVIGMPGDTVTCCTAPGGKLKVNGVAITEPYIYPGAAPSDEEFTAVVPEGKIWVMGDHRNDSADSRAHPDAQGGFVDISAIQGRADVIAWPLNRIGGVGTAQGAFDDVPDRPAEPYDPSEQVPASPAIGSAG